MPDESRAEGLRLRDGPHTVFTSSDRALASRSGLRGEVAEVGDDLRGSTVSAHAGGDDLKGVPYRRRLYRVVG
jgi:hypothetical protein